jgi:hypothetical protein
MKKMNIIRPKNWIEAISFRCHSGAGRNPALSKNCSVRAVPDYDPGLAGMTRRLVGKAEKSQKIEESK